MKAILPSVVSELQKRSGARVALYGEWKYDQSNGSGYTLSTDGRGLTHAYDPTHLRIANVLAGTQLAYFAEGPRFPSLRITLDNSDQRSNWLTPDACLYWRPLVGGDICLSLAVQISDGCSLTVPIMFSKVSDVRAAAAPQVIEITGISKLTAIQERYIDQTLSYASPVTPIFVARHMLAYMTNPPYAPADLDDTAWDAGEYACATRQILIEWKWGAASKYGMLDEVTRLCWLGLSSLYVSYDDLIAIHYWNEDTVATPDVTITEADIVAGSIQLVPRADRILTEFKIVVGNTYQPIGGWFMSQSGGGGGEGFFGTLSRTFPWNYYSIDCCVMEPARTIYRLFEGMDQCGDPTAPSVPTQLKVGLPLYPGIALELGDIMAVSYAPLALEAKKFRVEEIHFDSRSMTFDVVAHDRMF